MTRCEPSSPAHPLIRHEKDADVPGGAERSCGSVAYSRQANRKTKEGSHHPDRDGQFQHINRQVLDLQAAGLPVISVDTKKKELVGDYKNGGSDYRPVGCPDKVKVQTSSTPKAARWRRTALMIWQPTPAG